MSNENNMNRAENQTKSGAGWNRGDWLLLGFNATAFVILWAVFNDRLPDPVGSHYNLAGEQDGTMPKWGFWLMNAALLIGLPLLVKAARLMDPKTQNYEKFEGFFELFRWALSLFMLGVILMMIFTNLGRNVPVINLLLGGIGVLWMIIGNRLGQTRSNFTFGIRTPWTLMDEHNWKLTHRLGARLWFAAGLVMLAACGFVNAYAAGAILLIAVLASTLIPTLYSYLLFAKRR